MKQTPEIMAPVSNAEMLAAAIHSGADSIYIGMPEFNARGRADHLGLEDLKAIIEEARLYSVKTYIAFNILIFENELKEALEQFIEVDNLGPDAWIVQDIGLAVLLKKIKPQVNLHASTQATILNPHDILFFKDLFNRYTLARELSLDEIKTISESTRAELEVFIHGSLCISYSGQCFTSSGFGGRSANRGECAQSCRHEYDLYIDGNETDTGGHYLVSPRDLMAPEFAAKLSGTGVTALKIEGRLKSPEYVASAVRIYKHLNDKENVKNIRASQLSFSRAATDGWLGGHNYSGLIFNNLNTHTGVYLGKISSVSQSSFTFHNMKKAEVHKGDGLLIKTGNFEAGGFIFDVKTRNEKDIEVFMSRDFPFKKLRNKMDVYLTSSPVVEKETRKIFTDKSLLKRIPVKADLSGKPGEKLALQLYDSNNNIVNVISDDFIAAAQKQPPNEDLIKKEISALSSTPFSAEKITLNISSDSFVPNAVLKQLRQKAVEQLASLRRKPRQHIIPGEIDILKIIRPKDRSAISPQKTRLHVLARNPDQLNALLSADPGLEIETIYLDYTYGHPYQASVEQIRQAGKKCGIATMRVYKPGEESHVKKILNLDPDVILARNTTALEIITESEIRPEIVADFSLNITNHVAAEYYLSNGVNRITGSYDLVFDEGRRQDPEKLLSLIPVLSPQTFEICLRYYLPSFYMDYCLFSRYLDAGKEPPECGLPCTRHKLELKDRKGEFHPVIADNNCRNEMFNGSEKDISEAGPEFTKAGVCDFRIELGPFENDADEIRKLLLRISRKAGLH